MIGPLLLAAALAAPSPHGKSNRCEACHEVSALVVGPALPIVETCRGCHPTADMHPVGMAPTETPIPEGWPLHDGLVTCFTCHVEPAHGGAEDVAPPYHREGPYAPTSRLCFRCHERTSYTRSDPHHPERPGDATDGSCTACHRRTPATGAPAELAELREPPAEVCHTCHSEERHVGVASHVGAIPPADRRVALPPELPLAADGTVQCWTCHDVHPPTAPPARSGTDAATDRSFAEALRALALREDWERVSGEAVRWPGGDRGEHPALLALPADDGTLCEACHGLGGP